MLTNSDWMIINAITYKIQSIENFDDMKMAIERMLNKRISA